MQERLDVAQYQLTNALAIGHLLTANNEAVVPCLYLINLVHQHLTYETNTSNNSSFEIHDSAAEGESDND